MELELINVTESNPLSALATICDKLQCVRRLPQSYVSDLVHDGAWIERHGLPTKETPKLVYYWSVRPCGTAIGFDQSLVCYSVETHSLFQITTERMCQANYMADGKVEYRNITTIKELGV